MSRAWPSENRELGWLSARLSLVSDIAFDRGPVAVCGDGGDIVAVCPELSAPEVLLQFGKSLKQLFCGDGLEHPYDISPAVFGMEGAQYMDMVLVGTELLEDDVVPFGYIASDIPNCLGDDRCQECFAVFDRKDDVVVGVEGAVVRTDDGHARIVSREPTVPEPSLAVPRGRAAGNWGIKSLSWLGFSGLLRDLRTRNL